MSLFRGPSSPPQLLLSAKWASMRQRGNSETRQGDSYFTGPAKRPERRCPKRTLSLRCTSVGSSKSHLRVPSGYSSTDKDSSLSFWLSGCHLKDSLLKRHVLGVPFSEPAMAPYVQGHLSLDIFSREELSLFRYQTDKLDHLNSVCGPFEKCTES